MSFKKFSEGQIERAKEMSTIDVISHFSGFDFKRSGREWKCTEHDSLVVYADGRGWCWYSQNLKGTSALDWLVKVENMKFPEAVSALIGEQAKEMNASQIKFASKPPEEKKLILPNRVAGAYKNVYMYLTEVRKIDPSIVTECFKDKLIYQDEKKNCVFVGYDEQHIPKYASRRGTYSVEGAAPFKGDCTGSDKSYGFLMEGSIKTHIYVFESPIDALSHATLTLEKAKGLSRSDYKTSWKKHTRLSLGGVSDRALRRYITTHPELKEISFCLDNDEAGKKAATQYKATYEQLGYKVNVYTVPPTTGKDYNEFLCKFKETIKSKTLRQPFIEDKTPTECSVSMTAAINQNQRKR